MTVAELIKELSYYPQDLEVVVRVRPVTDLDVTLENKPLEKVERTVAYLQHSRDVRRESCVQLST